MNLALTLGFNAGRRRVGRAVHLPGLSEGELMGETYTCQHCGRQFSDWREAITCSMTHQK